MEDKRTDKNKCNCGDKKAGKVDNALGYLRDLTVLLTGVLLVFLLLFRVVIVSGSSMNSTLIDGDYILLLNNVLYLEPKQGDIVVASKDGFKSGEPIIKRVIATEGQMLDINEETGDVYVDGELLNEPYIAEKTEISGDYVYPLEIPEGYIFVMGDNRNDSLDSRFRTIGLIDERYVLGVAETRIYPFGDWKINNEK